MSRHRQRPATSWQERKARYRPPEDEGFFAEREPVSGEVPTSISQPPEQRRGSASPPDDGR